MDVHVTIGCEKHTNGNIDLKAGILGILDERVRKVSIGVIIPARANTECAHRGTSQCNVACPRAHTGYSYGGIISYQRKGMRI